MRQPKGQGDTMPKNDAVAPTIDGVRRYPPDGWYMDCGDPVAPCTCEPDCREPCRGECGCRACRAAYHDAIEGD